MNPIAEEILSILSAGPDSLAHYGVKRRSGRYPYGSGKDPYQHSGDFLSRVETLKKQGLNEKEIAEAVGLKTTELRVQLQQAKHERRQLEVDRAKSLREDGKSLNEIAEIMGYKNDSSIRALLDDSVAERKNQAIATAEALKKELADKKMLDVGIGVERELGVSKQKLQEALYILEGEGYNVYGVGVPQATDPKKRTTVTVLADPEITYGYAYQHPGEIQSVKNYQSTDGGSSFTKFEYPSSVDSNRIEICYGDQGGLSKDGVIELRRGVKDLDLGNSAYAQVRIMVDGTHYLKGMAIYADDLPDGVDIRFNTNKKSGTEKMDVLKKIKDDPDNPFGAALKMKGGQSYYDDPDGKYTDPITGKKQSLSAINKLKEEGDWDSMSATLSSQFLSKQPMQLINKQLDLTYKDHVAEYDDLCDLTIPTVKRKMLLDFANECDAAAVHLKAAALPRQKSQVILPLDCMPENEVYAPNYKNGEKVALIRHPHAGTFEIPVLTVNNKNKRAMDILGPNVKDAVGINSKVAEQLSGADFDGDHVIVIPTNDKVRIKATRPLDGLKDFDPKTEYSTEGKTNVKLMTKAMTQKQMGMVSNLITDMTLRGANEQEIVRAVKHSMVVIDAEKHKLDYKQSEKDNGIAELKQKYQIRIDDDGNEKRGGASTLISRSKQEVEIPERQGSGRIDPETGKVVYKESGRTYIDKKTGETKTATIKVSRMSTLDDAHDISSGTKEENAYADYANKMKALANQARKEALKTGTLKRDANAAEVYKEEVDRLNAALNVAAKNAPRERRAQAIANSVINAKIQDNPDMDKKEIKKMRSIAINNARASVSARGKDTRINISDKEWEAIQAGAVSDAKLTQILRYADEKVVREKATPRTTTQLSTAKVNKIKSMTNSGFTNAEIAEALGVSTKTVSKYLNND